jgi:excinuclease UvrABC ATPase subunit
MARQLDCDPTGLMYVLDEPSIGLHARDIDRLIEMLRRLRNKGNSVLVVEHDPAVIAAADHVVEIGPGAGRQGGQVMFDGPRDEFLAGDTLTARLMRGESGAAGGGGGAMAPRRRWADVWQDRGAPAQPPGRDVDIRSGSWSA